MFSPFIFEDDEVLRMFASGEGSCKESVWFTVDEVLLDPRHLMCTPNRLSLLHLELLKMNPTFLQALHSPGVIYPRAVGN